MQYLDVAISFLSLISLCVFFTKKLHINSALTPLLAVSATMLYFSVAGVIDQLLIGGYLFFIISFALGGYALFVKPKKLATGDINTLNDGKKQDRLITPGFLFFIISCVVIGVYFAVRQPIFAEWDELSLWGSASKLMKLENEMYTTAEISWWWIPTQLPGMFSLGYFMQFFGEVFAPWKVFLAYDVLYMAMFSAAVSVFDFKKYKIFVPTALICLLIPYFLIVYTRIVYPSNIYMSSYGDIPSGMMFGAVLVWYFSMRTIGKDQNKTVPYGFFGIFIVLMAGITIKDNAAPIHLVAAGIICMDILILGFGEKQKRTLKNISFRVSTGIMALLAPILVYVGWLKYIGNLAALQAADGGVGETNISIGEAVIKGFTMLFSPSTRSDRFNQAYYDMLDAFVNVKLCIIGSGLIITLLILFIFAITIIFTKDKLHKKRTGLVMLLSTGGFIGYYWVLIISYAFIFREAVAEGLASYNRYIQTYYVGWLFIAVVMLAIGARKTKPACVLKVAILGLSVLVLLSVSRYVRPQMSVLAYPESTFNSWRELEENANEAKEQIENDGKIFLVSQNDNGLRYFTYVYEFLPYQFDHSFGGGRTGPPEMNNESAYYHYSFTTKDGETKELDTEGFAFYLKENDCKYIFIDDIDDIFINEYASLFTDNLQGAVDGTVQMYERTSDTSSMYAPVEVQ